MIPAWLQRLLNICKKQPDHQDKPPAPKNTHNNEKAADYRNTQSTTSVGDGMFYIGAIAGGSGYSGGDGGSAGCGGGCGGCGGD